MKLYFIIIISALTLIFSSCSIKKEKEVVNANEVSLEETTTQPIQQINVQSVDSIPITRASVAKMIALTFNDKNTIDTTDIEINFDDVSNEWYTPYINIVVLQGYMSGVDKNFQPDGTLTLEQAQMLLDRLNSNNKIKIKMTDEIKDKPISYALWTELYIKMLEELSNEKSLSDAYSINIEDLIVLTTPANDSNQSAWTMTTDKGNYSFTGLNIDTYIDYKIKAYTKDNELISFIDIVDKEPILTNAYIVEATENTLKVFVAGAERTYKTVDMLLDTSTYITPIIDIKISQGTILGVKPAVNKINERFMRYDSNYIELASGKLDMWEDIKVYSNVDNDLQYRLLSNVICGSDIADFILKDNKVCAVIINKEFKPQNIRVVLGTTGFEKLVHSNVKLTATTDYNVITGSEIKKYSKGEIFEISNEINSDILNNYDRIYIKPIGGQIELQSITRNNGKYPQYRGTIEIAKQGDGFSIVSDVNLEEYLYSVVPSEMPTSYGIEAAKVQAITARSYAYNQIFANKYYRYGANVDDSIQSQVYNNTPENQNSTEAVNATKGMVLTYDGGVISANFFSTSAGVTANSGDVWMNTATKAFPATTPAYLTMVKQYQGDLYGNLSNEEVANKFFRDLDINSFDSQFSWFRWNVTMTAQELSASINANIKERYNANKFAIKTLVSENTYKSKDINSIGQLKDIQILKRGEAGNIMELLLVGSEATVKVLTEYNIRFILKPSKYLSDGKDIILNRKDGSKLSNYSLLPSAFFTLDKNLDDSGNLVSITFYGGGNGHGAGMSQNGVKAMSDMGYNYEQILLHYYKGTEIKSIG